MQRAGGFCKQTAVSVKDASLGHHRAERRTRAGQQKPARHGDTNGFACQGFSRYFVADLRLQWRIDRQWRASVGIDNLTGESCWALHPCPQRTFHPELRFDL